MPSNSRGTDIDTQLSALVLGDRNDPCGLGPFESLPDELLSRILLLSNVQDIFCVRRCTKHLYRLTKDRHLWLRALHNFCSQMRFPVIALVPDEDRLSSAEIEWILARHLRCRHNAMASSSSSEPLRRQVDSLKTKDCVSVKFIYGGRFLLTAGQHEIQFWDLGFGWPGRPLPEFPLATIEIPSMWESETTDVMVHDYGYVDEKLVVGVISYCVHLRRELYMAFELDPREASPSFKLIGQFYTEVWAVFTALVYPKLFFKVNEFSFPSPAHFLGVHDLKSGGTWRWSTGNIDFDVFDLFGSTGNFGTAKSSEHDCVSMYALPDSAPTTTYASGLRSPHVNNPPVKEWKGQLKDIDRESPHGISIAMYAFDDKDSQLGFEAWGTSLKEDAQDGITLTWNRLVSPPRTSPSVTVTGSKEDSVDTLPVLETSHSQVYPNLSLGFGADPYGMAFPDQYRFMWWLDPETITLRFHCSDLREGSSHSVSGVLHQREVESDQERSAVHWRIYTFSPIMGRGCFVEGKEIRVLDFVPKPVKN
ncbi:hypothetical protein DL96DRAFT_1627344 [Flagelloscypha sp. PMI_526]|nr:hypothetical protein DL96DRAFT_1627344 [Flagelloscypha sp. PMI_526]